MANKRLIDKVPCSDLRKVFGIQPIIGVIKDKVLKFEKKVTETDNGVEKITYQGIIEGKRSRGRPRRRWRENIRDWKHLNQNILTV